MSIVHVLLFFLILIWIIFLKWKRLADIILSRLLSKIIKNIFPEDDLVITVDHFGYFCANGVHICLNKRPLVLARQILLEFVWDESTLGLKLQSTVSDLTLGNLHETPEKCQHPVSTKVEIKGSVTLGINLISLRRPHELLDITPETECLNGSDIKISNLTQVWLFANNAEAYIIQQNNDDNDGYNDNNGGYNGDNDDIFYKLTVSDACALVLYNTRMARLVILVKNAYLTCCPISSCRSENLMIGTSDGLVLMYKFVDGDLISSHSRLKHTELELNPLALSTLEILLRGFAEQNAAENVRDAVSVDEKSVKERNKCEVAFEAESITADIVSPENLKRFQLKVAVVSLGTLVEAMTKWNTSVPFELSFLDKLTNVEEQVLGSKLKSDGMVNPCVLKFEGEDRYDTKWDISSHEGILVQIKPQYVSVLESFYEAYKTILTSKPDVMSSEESYGHSNDDNKSSKGDTTAESEKENTGLTYNREIFEISANICEIIIDVFDSADHKLLQVTMLAPQFSMSQDTVKRSLTFSIANLTGFNCLEDVPFFYPTDESEVTPSLSLSVIEEIINDENKVSYQNFAFGSCDTTVIVEETLIFAVLKYFGLHKKVAQIFFQNREDTTCMGRNSIFSRRFSFDYLELRAVQVILTLLPAIELPVDLQVIKNDLGIPHQLPPRFENAVLNFGAFVRNDIQYGSYKYISNDIKRHYLKELGGQSGSVLGSMHLLGNISRLKQDIISGFTTLRETGEFITFFRQVTSGVASSYSKFAGSWSDLFVMSYSARTTPDSVSLKERRHSVPSELDAASLQQFSESPFRRTSAHLHGSKDDTSLVDYTEDSDGIWLKSSSPLDVTEDMSLNWESSSSDGEGGFPLDFIPRNVKRQIKGQEFLRRLKENLGDNEHGEVFSCCIKVRKNDVNTKLNALLSNRKVYFLKGRPSHESLVLCVKYENLYKAQYIFQERTHYLQLIKKMKGITALSIPTRNASENPLVRCDNMIIARKVALKLNELKIAYDRECMHSQHQ